MEDKHWTALGACRQNPPDELFVEGAAQRQARQVCGDCLVRRECLVDALDSRVPFGVWGGMTERERRALLRRHPDVTSWREVLDAEPGLAGPDPQYRPRTAGPERRVEPARRSDAREPVGAGR